MRLLIVLSVSHQHIPFLTPKFFVRSGAPQVTLHTCGQPVSFLHAPLFFSAAGSKNVGGRQERRRAQTTPKGGRGPRGEEVAKIGIEAYAQVRPD